MKQYRITAADILPTDDNDCVLSPDDPIHDLKSASQLGGLGSDEALSKYRTPPLPQIAMCNKARIQQEQNIEPGTEAWFKLWFSTTK